METSVAEWIANHWTDGLLGIGLMLLRDVLTALGAVVAWKFRVQQVKVHFWLIGLDIRWDAGDQCLAVEHTSKLMKFTRRWIKRHPDGGKKRD